MVEAKEIRVQTSRPYSCWIGRGLGGRIAEQLTDCAKVAILCTPVTEDSADALANELADLDLQLLVLMLPMGEYAKTADVVVDCWSRLARNGFTRNDAIIGLGGGATTDVAGFIAATFLRGIKYIAMPTTLLGMVDAAVGGKTGIDIPEGKNLVGAFYEPAVVAMELGQLASLPARELRSGMAEVIKAGFVREAPILELIRKDPAEALDPGSSAIAELIARAVQFKADVVAADLYETTSTGQQLGRELLNYGHTLGHAIEANSNYQLRHGEAVSLGMIFAALLSVETLGLDQKIVELHRESLAQLGLPTSYHQASWDVLRPLLSRDKKARGAKLRFVGLTDLHQPAIIEAPAEELLAHCFAQLGRD